MSSTLESEDLDNVQLVRMEDVQPSRDIFTDDIETVEVKEEELETSVVDSFDYDNECYVDDDDSNVGSMVSIKSEDVIEHDQSTTEFIVPDIINPKKDEEEIDEKPLKEIKPAPEHWPTLEILPGGVIKHLEKCEDDLTVPQVKEIGEMYACAKCPQSFKFLFSLVKHVRWHEKMQKKRKDPDLSKLCLPVHDPRRSQNEFVLKLVPLKSNLKNIVQLPRVIKRRVPKKMKS